MLSQVLQDRCIVFIECCKPLYDGLRIVIYSVWWLWPMFQALAQLCLRAVKGQGWVAITDLIRLSQNRTKGTVTVTLSSKSAACWILRGKPSRRNLRFPAACALLISLFKSCVVSWAGSRTDFSMLFEINPWKGEVSLLSSSRSKSPTEMWWKSNSGASKVHCVPFPTPGPPEEMWARLKEWLTGYTRDEDHNYISLPSWFQFVITLQTCVQQRLEFRESNLLLEKHELTHIFACSFFIYHSLLYAL